MPHPQKQCDGHHQLHDKDEVNIHVLWSCIMEKQIYGLGEWKPNEMEKTHVIFKSLIGYLIPPSSFTTPRVQDIIAFEWA
jgi:hypothetical protein